MPNVIAGFSLEESDEAVFREGTDRANDDIHDDRDFEVVDPNGEPCEP